jgi:hypothetical protein
MSRLGHTSHTLFELNIKCMNIKRGGTYSNHWAYLYNFKRQNKIHNSNLNTPHSNRLV